MKEHTRSEAETKIQFEEVASGGLSFIDEVCEFPHYKYRGHMEVIDDVHYGKVLIGSSAFLGQRTPGRVKGIGPPAGYDSEDVYPRLTRLTKAEMDTLQTKGEL